MDEVGNTGATSDGDTENINMRLSTSESDLHTTRDEAHLIEKRDALVENNNASKLESSSPNNKPKRLIEKRDALVENNNASKLESSSPTNKPKICGMARGLALLIISSGIFAVGVTTALIIHICVGEHEIALHGAVAAESTACSKVGVTVLKEGGNAVDAAVASLFCLGVTENQNSGLGGGGFMIVHKHGQNKSFAIDFRETAPSGTKPEKYMGLREDVPRGLWVGVPGQIKGLEHAHGKFGKLTWRRLIEPSIKLAKEGYAVSQHQVDNLQNIKPADKKKLVGSLLGDIYMKDGEFVTKGTIITQPKLAETLELIAAGGANAVYGNGTIAQSIVDAVRKEGGDMTMEDLANYKVVERDPLMSTFHTLEANYSIVTMPLPGGGPALVDILNIVSALNWTPDQLNDTRRYYELIETLRYVYAARTGLGDPKFDHNGTIADYNATMTSLKNAQTIAKNITAANVTQANDRYPQLGNPSENSGTAHVSVVDSDEMFVSVTSTVNYILGAKFMTDTGIILNNELMDFTIGSPVNSVEPGKRPLSSMSPTVVMDNKQVNSIEPRKRPLSSMTPTVVMDTKQVCGPRFAVGGAGGTHIITGVAETIINRLVFGLDLEEAISRPRIINTLSDTTYYEEGLKDLIHGFEESLKSRDFTPLSQKNRLSYVMAVGKVNDTISAVTDPGTSAQADQF